MTHTAPALLPQRREVGELTITRLVVTRRSEMINGFTLHDTSSAPAASADILNGVKQA
jgi:hypothetical protein